MKINYRSYLLTLVAFLSVAAFVAVRVVAQENNQNSSGGIMVSPALIDQSDILPGESLTVDVKITNQDDYEKTVVLYTDDFKPAEDESGQAVFVGGNVEGSLSDWIIFPSDSIDLKPGERKVVPVRISVPEDAQPGSHHGAIVVKEKIGAPEGGNAVGAQYEVTILALINVAGDTTQEGQVLSFETDKLFYQYPPVNFFVRFENTGNTHIKPSGLIEIYNSAGGKEEVIQINKKFANVLPNSVRKFKETWDPKPWLGFVPRIGKYSAKGTLVYGEPSTTVAMGTVEFWLIPIPFILTVLGVVIGFILAIVIFLKLYAKAVVKSHTKKAKK